MRYKNCFFGWLLGVIAGCSPLVDPNKIADSESLVITTKDGKTDVKGNGIARTTILAQLPEETGLVDVSFSTTGGKFIYSNDKSIKELADSISGSFRYARAILQTDSLKANESTRQVYITAEVSNSRKRLTLTFVK